MKKGAGLRRERVKVQTRTEQSGFVEDLSDWSDLTPNGWWARIEPLMTSKEKVIADRLNGVGEYLIALRSGSEISALSTENRIVSGDDCYAIRSVIWSENKQMIYAVCDRGIE